MPQFTGENARALASQLGISITRARRALVIGIDAERADYEQRNPVTDIDEWHTSPDGAPCCCTEDDRRYGCGCH